MADPEIRSDSQIAGVKGVRRARRTLGNMREFAWIPDKPRRMSDTGNGVGHFLCGDGRFFRDDGHFSVHVGQIFFHVGQKFSNDGHFFENVRQSRAMLVIFFSDVGRSG
ncbi:hypothetical protein [Caldibacillus debilis]|uniref:hypothetical protein n=1 Tax=Caldibacillus debilis TaxID=301148 RepID=UPI0012B51649|nr:hypothetical protein [Caldibacillus debilis]